jgi:hypothetical protein
MDVTANSVLDLNQRARPSRMVMGVARDEWSRRLGHGEIEAKDDIGAADGNPSHRRRSRPKKTVRAVAGRPRARTLWAATSIRAVSVASCVSTANVAAADRQGGPLGPDGSLGAIVRSKQPTYILYDTLAVASPRSPRPISAPCRSLAAAGPQRARRACSIEVNCQNTWFSLGARWRSRPAYRSGAARLQSTGLSEQPAALIR